MNNNFWWQHGIIYHIYPRSFMDHNGDGVGDLRGIINKLDYLSWLGVDAIWLSPVYPSPMADAGYDVANYIDIDPLFGSLDDMDELIAEAHQRNLRVILDYVPNHTSHQHAWFRESRMSHDSPKRDWYIWRDPAPEGGVPNNWLTRFGGHPAWTWDEPTQQYYYHTFLPEQPELNWRSPELQQAMFDVLRFWCERGSDGFRIDVIHRIIKDAQLRDNPPNPRWKPGMDPYQQRLERYTRNQPEVHDVIRMMRATVEAYPERILVGEVNVAVEELMTYYGAGDELHLPFNFQIIHDRLWDAADLRRIIDQYEALLPDSAWPTQVLGNHDEHRLASKVGAAQARVGMMLLLTLRGTPTIYYGDEIGMHDVKIPPELVQDPWEKFVPGIGAGRDPQRTPMQWDTTSNAGFCPADVTPWLPIADDYTQTNVAAAQTDTHSMLSLTRALIALRRTTPALTQGSYRSINAPNGIFAYFRKTDIDQVLIVLNTDDQPKQMGLPPDLTGAHVILSTYMDRSDEAIGEMLELRGDEGLIVKVT